MKEAMLYERLEEKAVKCNLCSHRCRITEAHRGICSVRENRDGRLYTLVYGKAVSEAVDPIEKKPLFHFFPGSTAYSIATVGCNFRCANCQNYEISQLPKERRLIVGEDRSSEKIVASAKRYRSRSIAYTYTEPTVFFEYAYDTAKLASSEGIKNIFVTNGYITEEALKEIKPYLHGANIDLKSMNDDVYRKNCGATLEPILESIKRHKDYGVWIELTTLIIPTLNDSEEELRKIAEFIVSVGKEIPWHVTQFYPTYRLTHLPRTPLTTLRRAREIGLEAGLRYVYEGNVPGEGGENTYCYKCGALLIRRYGYEILENKIRESRCPICSANIDGVGI